MHKMSYNPSNQWFYFCGDKKETKKNDSIRHISKWPQTKFVYIKMTRTSCLHREKVGVDG